MTFEEQLKSKIEQAKETEYVSLDTLDSSIQAKVFGEPVFKQDARGNEGLYIVLVMKDNQKVVQKYTKTLYQALETALEECGGLASLQKNSHTWMRRKVGRAFNPRYYPIPQPRKP